MQKKKTKSIEPSETPEIDSAPAESPTDDVAPAEEPSASPQDVAEPVSTEEPESPSIEDTSAPEEPVPARRHLDQRILIVLLYLSFCAAEFFTFRGTYAALMTNFGVPSAVVSNSIVAFFLGGLIPFVLYELISRFLFRFAQASLGGRVDEYAYILRVFYIAANAAIFLLKLLYLWFPLLHIYGDILIDFVITSAAFAVFLWYVLRREPKEHIAPILYRLGGSYVIVYGVIALIKLLLEVL